MSLKGLCDFAERENIRLRWRCRLNGAGTLYRIELIADCAEHIGQHWSEPYPVSTGLADALDNVAAMALDFYRATIASRRTLAPA